MKGRRFIAAVGLLGALLAPLLAGRAGRAFAQEPWRFILPEQRQLEIRSPSQMPRARFPDLPTPPTVANPQSEAAPRYLALDEAIRIALDNAQVVRVLAGVTAVSSGRTIYDPAISNTQIDNARARFDPALTWNNNFFREDRPDRMWAGQLTGNPRHAYEMSMGLAKTTLPGGTAELNVRTTPSRSRFNDPPTINPQAPSSVELGYTQPLLQGAGVGVNVAPIVIARIDTERSFFQLKDSVQEMVRGVVEGYWALVLARIDAWARQQQVDQGQEALDVAQQKLAVGAGDFGDVAQAAASLANFRATLVASQANVLQREAALRNLLGLPPSDTAPFIPVTAMSTERLDPKWQEILALAEEYRPDLIELKLILEADQQRLRMADNQALPRLDAVAVYRWNGLEGRLPDGTFVRSAAGDFTDWQLGVNFSVPLGLRQARALLRQQELLIMHDRANLDQGLHAAGHDLAQSLRDLADSYEQYRALTEAREAARENREYQLAVYRENRDVIYLNVLQAIVGWGNAVSAQAQALARYNAELANLERQTGTILESHGIRFLEERYCSIGPLGRMFRQRPYPMSSPPGANTERYPTGAEPAEKALTTEKSEPARPN